ncbi:MAG: hypothetical protein RIC03_17710 [Cyclobacteriaceae bacterium]
MNKYLLPFINSVTLAFTLWANYWANSGAMNGHTVGEISRQYNSLFTPAGYAFSIWGIIFLGLIALVINQWIQVANGRDAEVNRAGIWLAVVNLLNGSWTIVWISEMPGLSVVIMLLLLLSLTILVIKLDMEKWDAPMRIITWTWWPIAIYYGWIVLATVANVSAWLVSIQWQFLFSEVSWTIIMILIATAVFLFLIATRNLREAAGAGIWGLYAIVSKQIDANPSIAYTAIAGMIILIVACGIQAYQNRATLPFIRKS